MVLGPTAAFRICGEWRWEEAKGQIPYILRFRRSCTSRYRGVALHHVHRAVDRLNSSLPVGTVQSMSQQPHGPPLRATATATFSLRVQEASSITASLAATTVAGTSIPHGRPSSLSQSGPPADNHTPTGPTKFSAESSHMLIGVTCMFLVLCLTVVVGRLCSRRMARVKYEMDDWMAILAFVRPLACLEKLKRHFADCVDVGHASNTLHGAVCS